MKSIRTLPALLALAVLLPTTAAAQFGSGIVKDPWNLIENATTASQSVKAVLELRDQLERMDTNLEAWLELYYRDQAEFLAYLNDLAAQGEPWSYATPDVYGVYKEAVQPYLAFTPEVLEVIDYPGVFEIWQGSAVDTFASTLAAAAEQGAAELAAEEDRLELLGALNGSGGNLQALQSLGIINLHIAQEVTRLNQLLSSVVSNQAAFYGHQLASRGASEATNRYLIAESLALLPADGMPNEYSDEGGFTGLPPGID